MKNKKKILTYTLAIAMIGVVSFATVNYFANGILPVIHSGDEVKLNLGYDATGICGNFLVLPLDRGGATPTTANWDTARNYCTSLCPTCFLPTSAELACMCTNKASFGNNFVANFYWSATEYFSFNAWYVLFSNGFTNAGDKTFAYYVRCVRR
jgi:hypothetical protein